MGGRLGQVARGDEEIVLPIRLAFAEQGRGP
jgi:hypothetical protein